jgi:phytanoyl-CoA hydroxylase
MSKTQATPIPRAAALRRGQNVDEYDRQGYVIISDVLDSAMLAEARQESVAICRGLRGHVEGNIAAADEEVDDAVLRHYLCVHFPHKISSLARDIARLPAAIDVLTRVVGPNVKMMQSMLFIKSEGKPGQAWHQDETHIPTRDRSLTGGGARLRRLPLAPIAPQTAGDTACAARSSTTP